MIAVSTLTYLETFPFIDQANALVTGKVNANWSKVVTRNGATSAVAVTVSEVSGQSGYYSASLTPDTVGSWTVVLSVDHSGYTYRFSESFAVVTAQQADPARSLSGVTVTSQNPVSAQGKRLTIRNGDTYSDELGNAIAWTYTGAVDLEQAASVTLTIRSRTVTLAKACTVSGSPSAQTVSAELTGTETAGLKRDEFSSYDVIAVIGGNDVTVFAGAVAVLPDPSP